nr:hypothetical protein REQ54_04287 [Rhizobium sp. Q54]
MIFKLTRETPLLTTVAAIARPLEATFHKTP